MAYRAYFYLRSSGRSPLADYLKSIKSVEIITAIEALIARLIDSNCSLGPPYIKPVAKKIYELRLAHYTGNYRVFYFIIQKGKIVLLDGYTKKTDKIPRRILKRIKNYYFDYLLNTYEEPY